MKKNIAFSLLLTFLVTACTAPLKTASVENTAAPATPIQFTLIPTLTAKAQTAVQPTLTPPAMPIGQLNEIKFKANGTYVDITDTIALGANKTYSINAMKGQIMSISILPQIPDGSWGYIPMQIQGADGSILCPQVPDYECMFWRGALPATQDYLVTLTPNGDVPQFVMRVAINPPGKASQSFQYTNPVTGLSLTYPDTFAPALPPVGNYKTNPELALHFIDSNLYDKTNLSEVYLFLTSTSAAQAVATCTDPNPNGGGPEQLIGNEVVNGFDFVHSTADGAGAGNYYQQEIYRMVNKNICYEVIYFIHYTNIGNYTPGTVTEFDSNAIMQSLGDIFDTFKIK